ncbi:type 1 glutamine amidotransferase [Rhodothermus sp. AH-315-K08]|nr:type 1 glutamine amidotransferase [Rhodothermus sp. AH-315-K08]
MNIAPPRPRILLLQAREEPDMELQEQECFVERCRISSDQLIPRNVIRDRITAEMLSGFDGLLIGGAGAFSATQDYPWTESVLDLIRAAADSTFPTFGSCWGHQMIARAMGGRVVHDPAKAEMGCHRVNLTEAGQKDQLFSGFPATFKANMGHHDRVVDLPAEAVELADNPSQPFQAIRMGDLPMYGTQFHSELDAARERDRLIRYREHYLDELPTEELFQAVIDDLAETTDVDHLLADFVKMFVDGGGKHSEG